MSGYEVRGEVSLRCVEMGMGNSESLNSTGPKAAGELEYRVYTSNSSVRVGINLEVDSCGLYNSDDYKSV